MRAHAPERIHAPLVVFLHEGLGSVAMWRDFPERPSPRRLSRAGVFAAGYGRSTPRTRRALGCRLMHRQAHEVLPAVFDARASTRRPAGHSDGGSIALLHAARFPERVAGLVLLAPHIFVEDLTVVSIDEARRAWETTDLPQKLGRYHDDAEATFRGWNDIWLHPPFKHWNIEAELDAIRSPILAMQGLDDVYGTLRQIRGIAERVLGTELVELPECGHSPHRDQPETAIVATISFINARRSP
ncbi:MAG: alpha/beta hydrolase [Variovorax sp.]